MAFVNTNKNMHLSIQLQNVLDFMEIPYFDISGYTSGLKSNAKNGYLIDMYPSWSQTSIAILTLIRDYNWKKIIFIYEDSSGTYF
jgi:hypothetical protein